MDNANTNQVDTFLEELLKNAGLDVTLPQVKEEMMKDLRAKLDTALIVVSLEQLKEDQLNEFNNKVAEGMGDNEKLEYLRSKIPNIEEIYKDVMLDFYNSYVPQK